VSASPRRGHLAHSRSQPAGPTRGGPADPEMTVPGARSGRFQLGRRGGLCHSLPVRSTTITQSWVTCASELPSDCLCCRWRPWRPHVTSDTGIVLAFNDHFEHAGRLLAHGDDVCCDRILRCLTLAGSRRSIANAGHFPFSWGVPRNSPRNADRFPEPCSASPVSGARRCVRGSTSWREQHHIRQGERGEFRRPNRVT